MEWIVPVLFVFATVVQWWLKHRQVAGASPSKRTNAEDRPSPSTGDEEPTGDFGDLLEALGRRRHESPPPPVLPGHLAPTTTPPVQPQTHAPAFHLPPPPLAPIQDTPVLGQTVIRKSPEVKQKTHPSAPRRQALSHVRSHLREAVVMSEILAPPLALR